ncbi:TM2 domain-containing protein [Micromonospora qiuiae]|nr:TM2 domain-containing protein [Micromonospora qiuiae]
MTTPPMQPGYSQGVSDKSKIVAGILQILLPFGVGRFYMGDTKTGVIQLIVTLVTCGFGGIWGVIDGILILVKGGVDGQGRPLRD